MSVGRGWGTVDGQTTTELVSDLDRVDPLFQARTLAPPS